MRIVTRILTIINNFDSDITMKGFSLVSPDFQKNHLDLVWRKKQSSTPRKSHFRRVVKAGWIFCIERFQSFSFSHRHCHSELMPVKDTHYPCDIALHLRGNLRELHWQALGNWHKSGPFLPKNPAV